MKKSFKLLSAALLIMSVSACAVTPPEEVIVKETAPQVVDVRTNETSKVEYVTPSDLAEPVVERGDYVSSQGYQPAPTAVETKNITTHETLAKTVIKKRK